MVACSSPLPLAINYEQKLINLKKGEIYE